MFDHSIKVPRLYKIAAKIYKEVQESNGSLKQLVYEANHQNIKALYALVAETLKKRSEIDNLFRRSQLCTNEPRLDPILARILITELIWGKQRLAGESKPVKTILAYEQIFKAHLPDIPNKSSGHEDCSQVLKPRYVRINTLVTSMNKAVDAFRDEEWNFIRCTNTNDYEGFLEAAKALDVYDYMVDIHIPNLLLFHPKTQFYNHSAYRDGEIILQDKASCLPVHILSPQQGSTVLDMCAAPGMKTTQIAAMLNDQGTVYAIEFDRKRMEVLDKMIESAGAKCIKTINRDVLTITDQECPNVEYILVDPSCSGSGIIDRLDLDENPTKDQDRLNRLAGFQIKILRHALTRFPSAKRVVYSTCSLNVEENEDVVRQVLETCTTFKLVPASKFVNDVWFNFGSPDFGDIGKFCLYTRPEIDLTNGFFVAVFERLEDGEENPLLNKNAHKKIRTRNKRDQDSTELAKSVTNAFECPVDSYNIHPKKKEEKKGAEVAPFEEYNDNPEEANNDFIGTISSKVKKRTLENYSVDPNEDNLNEASYKDIKKKKRKQSSVCSDGNNHNYIQQNSSEKSDQKESLKTYAEDLNFINEDNLRNSEDTKSSKKKKKKRKNVDTELGEIESELYNLHEDGFSNMNDTNQCKRKKKEKGNQNLVYPKEGQLESVVEEKPEANVHKKRKVKNEQKIEATDKIEESGTTLKKNKKHKKANIELENDSIEQMYDANIGSAENTEVKKKKKRKNRIVES